MDKSNKEGRDFLNFRAFLMVEEDDYHYYFTDRRHTRFSDKQAFLLWLKLARTLEKSKKLSPLAKGIVRRPIELVLETGKHERHI